MRAVKYIIYASLIILIIPIVSCNLFGSDDEDACDSSIAPQISVDFHYIVRTFYQVEGEERQPLENTALNIYVNKVLCDGEEKGFFNYDQCDTGEDNLYYLTPIGYNLHNTEDYVRITAEVYYVPDRTDVNVYRYDTEVATISYAQAQPYDNMQMTKYVDIVMPAYRYGE